ncbi:ATP-binding cassette domain-containing protein [Streptococcus sciuri]|uniref:ATP-binding cassette domain-containing protein n=1 Tax=Streptococcus sciuri TaxID=2973939 RepID=A0ABT2F771_9STRE|nr:ATP-binding cassette domain-containing protein [Streptococcus sciuri]MCS4487871.1 ATP-binding cassette domain-containing protein [Streptococcus sciuri]
MIKRSPSSFCIASHDRALLEEVATKIWVIEQGKVKQYDCTYEDYLIERAYETSHYQSELKNYEREKRKIKKSLQQMKEKKDKKKGKPRKMSTSEYRIAGVKTTINVKQKKLQKGITQQEDKLNQLKPPKQVTEDYGISFLTQVSLRPKRQLVVPAYSAFVGERLLWKSQDLTLKSGDRLAIKGANGSGKTTFLNYLMKVLPKAYKVGYFRQRHLDFLDSNDTVLVAVSKKADGRLDENQLRTLLALLDFKREKVFRKIKDLSQGERVKISFLALLVSDLDVLLLDEITNFLDMKTIEACEKVLNTFSGILVFVSHDYYFIEHVANRVVDIEIWKAAMDD